MADTGSSSRTGQIALLLSLSLGFISFISALIISRYGPTELVLVSGATSLILIMISLILLWKILATEPEQVNEQTPVSIEDEAMVDENIIRINSYIFEEDHIEENVADIDTATLSDTELVSQ